MRFWQHSVTAEYYLELDGNKLIFKHFFAILLYPFMK